MSVRSIARVWEGSRHSGTELLMLLAIADFADDDGRAYPSVAGLATKCRMQPRNARYILGTLQESGELKVQINAGPRGANLYRLVFSAMPGLQPVAPLQAGAGVQGFAGVGLQRSAGVQRAAGLQPIAATPAMHCRDPLQPIAAEPSLNRQEPSTKGASRAAAVQPSHPNWLPTDAWEAFVDMRKKLRKPMTQRAEVLIVSKLGRLRDDGEDVRAVLEQSVMSSWQNVYPVKDSGAGRGGNDPMGGEPWAGAT